MVLGGGREQFTSNPHSGDRKTDGKDYILFFKNMGYSYVTNKQDLEQVRNGKVLGLFAKLDMSFEIDRDKKTEPSFYDMTKAAIRLLADDNPRGFFAFIENENIDTAAHLNDIAALNGDLSASLIAPSDSPMTFMRNIRSILSFSSPQTMRPVDWVLPWP